MKCFVPEQCYLLTSRGQCYLVKSDSKAVETRLTAFSVNIRCTMSWIRYLARATDSEQLQRPEF